MNAPIYSQDTSTPYINNAFELSSSSTSCHVCYDPDSLKLLSGKNKLTKFEGFDDDWDGYGSPKINKDAINIARYLLDDLYFPPKVFPTCRGTVQFEFKSKKYFIAVEIIDSANVKCFYKNRSTKKVNSTNFSSDYIQLKDSINHFLLESKSDAS